MYISPCISYLKWNHYHSASFLNHPWLLSHDCHTILPRKTAYTLDVLGQYPLLNSLCHTFTKMLLISLMVSKSLPNCSSFSSNLFLLQIFLFLFLPEKSFKMYTLCMCHMLQKVYFIIYRINSRSLDYIKLFTFLYQISFQIRPLAMFCKYIFLCLHRSPLFPKYIMQCVFMYF